MEGKGKLNPVNNISKLIGYILFIEKDQLEEMEP